MISSNIQYFDTLKSSLNLYYFLNLSNPSAFVKCQESGLPRVDTFDKNKGKQSSGNNVLFQDLEKQNKNMI